MNSNSHRLEKLFKLPKKSVWSLSTLQQISEIYNHPEKSFKTIHVAGTNGKGSVCTKIAKALEIQGYKVGLFTSPHLENICERIQISGEMISEDDLLSIIDDLAKLNLDFSFFEMITAASFIYFQKKGVEIAVIETGIGGRLDATNIITPLLSVITSIGFDHTEMLGDTLEKIAFEKAGIIKPKTPVVLGPDLPKHIFEKIAAAKESPLYQSTYRCHDFEQENQATAALSLQVLQSQLLISQQAIDQGLAAKPPCRFQIIQKGKTIVLDVAHNPHGFTRLLEKLESTYPHHAYHFILAFSKDKDIEGCLDLITPKAASIHLPLIPHPRLAHPSEIGKLTSHPNVHIITDIFTLLNTPSTSPEIVIIAGSFFLLKDLLR
jgi:dihydrofolate synthase/folylpolyglutamate synthase